MFEEWNCKCWAEGAIIFLVILSLFLLLKQYFPRVYLNREGFEFSPLDKQPPTEKTLINQLMKPGSVVYYQGTQVPAMFELAPPPADDEKTAQDKPVVSCGKDAPRALTTFAFNRCDPNCCSTSPYSCSGGCVCIPEEQRQLLKTGKCSKDVVEAQII